MSIIFFHNNLYILKFALIYCYPILELIKEVI